MTDNSERSQTPPTPEKHVANDAGDCVSWCPACAVIVRAQQAPLASNTSTIYPDCMQGPSEPCAGYTQLLNHAESHRREVERLTRERDQLLSAIGEHVTVRSDQYAQIQRLTRERDTAREALRISEQRVREHWPGRDRLRAALATARTAILRVDDLLAAAGYAADSSARNLLMCGCPDKALSDEPNSTPETNWRQMREHELRHIEKVLRDIRKQDGEGARESADDTLQWLRNRLTVQVPDALGHPRTGERNHYEYIN